MAAAFKKQLCRICITSNSNEMIPIFGEASLWQKITMLADVKIEEDDTLPQQVCLECAKSVISAYRFKKKCQEADSFFRQQLILQRFDQRAENKCNQHVLNSLSYEEVESSFHVEEPCENNYKIHRDMREEHKLEGIEPQFPMNDESTVENELNHRLVAQHISSIGEDTRVAEDGEITSVRGRPASFDISSIRMMHEYMQQHLSKINGMHSANHLHHNACGSEGEAVEDEESLPLVPEIELITPADDQANGLIQSSSVQVPSTLPSSSRGYQCPSCFQIFEMKQILKAHMQSVHGSAGPVYECSNCKKTYFYKRFLEKHVRRGRCVKKRRNQTRPMECSDCHVLFPTGHHLGWHKRTGCPSRAAKVPLQQLFKHNIVQYNNFPKRLGLGIRKPDNTLYIHNRKLIMANKRKGRTRIKLDAKKIALAKQLILREATTTVIANELNISRTFAWRLRKSLVNGVSLHERVMDPNTEDIAQFVETHTKFDNGSESNDDEHNNGRTCEVNDERNIEQRQDLEFPPVVDTDVDTRHSTVNMKSASNRLDYIGEQQVQQNSPRYGVGSEIHDELIQTQVESERPSIIQHVSKQIFFQDFPKLNDGDSSSVKDMVFPSVPKTVEPNPFTPAISAAIHQLPVNLSIRAIAPLPTSNTVTSKKTPIKKPRKPNVFIDDEKYAMAKLLVAQNSSTMEIARALNVSQMTAWKVRDAIVKGLPLSYRNKRDRRNRSNTRATSSEPDTIEQDSCKITNEYILDGDLKHQQEKMLVKEQHNLIMQQQRQEKEEQQELQQQQHQQFQLMNQFQIEQKRLDHSFALDQNLQCTQLIPSQTNIEGNNTKVANPRRRLKAAERELRDREITREILELIKEDNNIQYWKVSARLAEKGYPISPSSVCQKLKAMGIHRRWKPGDKPPQIDMDHLKTSAVPANSSEHSLPEEEIYEQHFDIGGAHFLSAFTR